jgi:hypothetical protein
VWANKIRKLSELPEYTTVVGVPACVEEQFSRAVGQERNFMPKAASATTKGTSSSKTTASKARNHPTAQNSGVVPVRQLYLSKAAPLVSSRQSCPQRPNRLP